MINSTHFAGFSHVIMRTDRGGETICASYEDEQPARDHADRMARNTDHVDVCFLVRAPDRRVIHDVRRGRGVR